MKSYKIIIATVLCAVAFVSCKPDTASRETLLKDWTFNGEPVRVPHDWAIGGEFDRANDLQVVQVVQNGEDSETIHTGRTGGLPWMGKGVYKTTIRIDRPDRRWELYFDGAMSGARVYVNGRKAGYWPYGYNAFSVDITPYVHRGSNSVKVELENLPLASRWYPGAGLYRPVKLIDRPLEDAIPTWGIYVTTPEVSAERAIVCINAGDLTVSSRIFDASGALVAEGLEPSLEISSPHLWSPSSPYLYTLECRTSTDVRTMKIGIRSYEFRAGEGFFLNGEPTKFKGVCNHHDLGPLGAAENESILRYRLGLLKDMGCNALRTSHNMPSTLLVELCDELGFMVIAESFDEWATEKCETGYHRLYDEWMEKDLVNLVRHFRSNPSVVLWSIGNEVPDQSTPEGKDLLRRMQYIVHREDPTRLANTGMDHFENVLVNGFAAGVDVPGFNYRVNRFEKEAIGRLPQGFLLSTESASTLSSRGVYHFPVEVGYGLRHDDHQCSSYDVEYCWWSNKPDDDFRASEDFDWCLGQFVWTGFDYLGEPTPYDLDDWPNHSSMFGIIDLASLPKDRYWLYRSVWNTSEPTLHVLPHWTWPGREGETAPVYVYTSYPSAELFVNGESQGRRSFSRENYMTRHRLMWNDVVYQPGELRVVAYDAKGAVADEKVVRTAGEAYSLKLSTPFESLAAGGDDMALVTVTVLDASGNPVPSASNLVSVSVSGAGSFEAIANGDPTCIENFRRPEMHLFSGALTAVVRSGLRKGNITVTVSSDGLRDATLTLKCE